MALTPQLFWALLKAAFAATTIVDAPRSDHGARAAAVSQDVARPALWGDLIPGPHGVGFNVIAAQDSSRPFRPVAIDGSELSPMARPIQISVWFPARAETNRKKLTFGDYAGLVGSEGRALSSDTTHAEAGRREVVSYLSSLGADREAAGRVLASVTAASRSARRANGRFPVVVVLSGKDGSPVEHVVLAEYLASYGFVVAAAPAMGAHQRTMAWTPADVDAQTADLAFILRQLRSEPSADLSRVGVVGFSFGAGPGIIAGQQRDDIRAIVSLDGSIGFRDRVPVYQQIGIVASGRLPPVLHFNILGLERNQTDYLDSLAPRLAIASIAGGDHLAFTTLGMFQRAVPELELAPFRSLPDPAKVHTISISLTKAFLIAHLYNRMEVWSEIVLQAPKLGEWPAEAGHLRP